MNTPMCINCSQQDKRTEAANMLQFLRALGTEEQRLAFAVLEGMKLQKTISATDSNNSPEGKVETA